MKIKEFLKFMTKRKDCHGKQSNVKPTNINWQVKYITILKLNQIFNEIEDFKKEIEKRSDVNFNEWESKLLCNNTSGNKVW